MAKTFMGVRLRSLRAERGLTQVALAQALELSPSYLNQIEQDQRPLTVSVLLRIHRVLGVDIQQFSEDEEARLLAQLRDAVAAMPLPEAAVPLPELREVAARLPQLAQALLAIHQRHLADAQRLEALSAHLGDGRAGQDGGGAVNGKAAMAGLLTQPSRQMPFEAVRDFFFCPPQSLRWARQSCRITGSTGRGARRSSAGLAAIPSAGATWGAGPAFPCRKRRDGQQP